MINIPSHKGNANQNHTEILSHSSQNGSHPNNNNKCWQGWQGGGGVNLIKGHYVHVCKHYYETPVYNHNMLKKEKKRAGPHNSFH
jgi:hypothetical protein